MPKTQKLVTRAQNHGLNTRLWNQDAGVRTHDTGPMDYDPGPRASHKSQTTCTRTKVIGPTTQDLGHGTRNTGHVTRVAGHDTWDTGPRIEEHLRALFWFLALTQGQRVQGPRPRN